MSQILKRTILTPNIERKTGADCSGTEPDKNRTLTLSNTTLSSGEMVFVDASPLHEGAGNDYTIVHNAAASVITFLNNIWDSQKIMVKYETY